MFFSTFYGRFRGVLLKISFSNRCGGVTGKSINSLLELKKQKKIPQFLIAYKKDEPPAEEGGCRLF